MDDRGASAIILALALVPLVLVLGLAVDAGLAYSVKSRLQGAVDSAVLAGTQNYAADPDRALADARMFLDANFQERQIRSELVSFESDYDRQTHAVSIRATARVETAFMRLAGVNEVMVQAAATAEPRRVGLELAMVLDITGSMLERDRAGMVKIDSLKSAAGTLLDVLYGERDAVDGIAVALVPYNNLVNIGTDRRDWLTGFDRDAYGAAGWAGCVEARAAPHDQDDTSPFASPFTAMRWPGNSNPNGQCPSSVILPLTKERSILQREIDGMTAAGSTLTNVGFVWGWRTLSPEWRTAWALDKAPVDYNNDMVKKAIVFMTDGRADLHPSIYTAYGMLAEGRLGMTNERAAENQVNVRLRHSCRAAKEAGVEVYAVMFALDDPSIEAVYRQCASSDDHFFNAPTGEQLEAAFKNIAGQLTALRLIN